MCDIIINGGRPLSGSVSVHGAKNSVLPILAATVLCEGISVLHGCPNLMDVDSSIDILKCLGCKVEREGTTIIVDSSVVNCNAIPDDLMHKMRSSITFLGAITSRCGKASMSSPGGCELGPRPIDLHIKALRMMGIRIEEKGGHIESLVEGKIKGCDIHLDFPSVGATENIMLTAVMADGRTKITNAAKEPEINDLQNILNKMGAKISGAGTDIILIDGVKSLHGTEHKIIADRIVAATYLCATAMTGGKIELLDVDPVHINAVLSVLKDTGSTIYVKKDSVILKAPNKIYPIDILRTQPYPGFPTDAQALVTAMLTIANGTSIVIENIFENRFKHCDELGKLGANIKIDGRVAVIRGVPKLYGSSVTAMELRGGAALIIAGLAAEGQTIVKNTEHINRGYDTLVSDMALLGADIKQ